MGVLLKNFDDYFEKIGVFCQTLIKEFFDFVLINCRVRVYREHANKSLN